MTSSTPDEETPKERRDREFGELLQEMRVVITGVQVLFAFLLTVPFTQRFPTLSGAERTVFFAAILAAAFASMLLIAPAANHRLLFREGEKEQLLKSANVLVITGLTLLAAGIGLSLYLVTSVVFTTKAALLTAAAFVVIAVLAWFVLPRLLREMDD